MMINESIYKKTAAHVTELYETYQHPSLVYHTLEHTQNVVARAEEIAAHYEIADSQMLTIYIAAWFHDTGHLFADFATHENKSVELMQEFTRNLGIDESMIESIAGCIMATRMPHDPKNTMEEIMCDADTYHFGTSDFKKTNKQIKKEYELRNFKAITLEWEKNTLELLERHHFFTSYCQVLLAEGKEKNIKRAKKKWLKAVSKRTHGKLEETEPDPKLEKIKANLVSRGIQTMLRLTSENHMKLSDMADGKANILISVNAIIISVILSVLVRKLEVEPYLTIPTLMFLGSSVITIVISILATRPKITEGKFTKDDVLGKRTNLLFFGNFHKSTMADFEWAMSILMKDKDYLYNSLVRDIYFLGVVLGKKYRLLRLAYTVFMIGIVISVIAFLVAALLSSPKEITTISMPENTPL